MLLGLSGLKLYIAIGLVLAIVLLLATNAVLVSRIQLKDAELESKSQQLQAAAGDVARLQAWGNSNVQTVRRQADRLRQLESDGAAAAAIGADQLQREQNRNAGLQAEIDKLRRKARENPEDVRDLGPITRGALPALRAGGLRQQPVPAGADPAGS